MRGLLTVLLLVVSNVFMTFAWYGNLKLEEMKITTDWPLFLIIGSRIPKKKDEDKE